MRYTVVWEEQALNELARIWMQSPDWPAVNAASNEVDRQLATDPESKGIDFYGDRLLVVGPLHVTFRVNPGDRTVTVQQVWRVN